MSAFVSSELLEILSIDAEKSTSDADEVLIDGEQMKQHFGEFFASNPTRFKFLSGDRKCIQKVINLIQDHIQKYGRKRAMNHFIDKSKNPQQSCKRLKMSDPEDRSISEVECNVENAHCSLTVIESNLYTSVMQKMVKSGIPSSILNKFDKSIVRTGRDEKGNIYGEVSCIACRLQKDCQENVKPKKVYYRSKAGKKSWVLSNFTKHLEKHKDITNHMESESFQWLDVEIASEERTDLQVSQGTKSLANFSTESIEAICDWYETETARIEKVGKQL